MPGIAYQLLVYPVVDITMSYPSIKENAEGYLLTKEAMDWFMSHYYDEGTDVTQPLLSPLVRGRRGAREGAARARDHGRVRSAARRGRGVRGEAARASASR